MRATAALLSRGRPEGAPENAAWRPGEESSSLMDAGAALPADTERTLVRTNRGGPHEPAEGAVESELIELWKRVLGVGPVGRRDRFSDLGGHSLLAAELLLLIERRWGVRLPEEIVFSTPTPAGMAERIVRERAANLERDTAH